MSPRKTIEAEPATRVEPVGVALDPTAGEDSGLVEIKTRVPIHLHLALQNCSERNLRSMAAELRYALQQYVEREAAGRR